MTVNSRIINTFLSWTPEAVDVPLAGGMRIQILPSVVDLARARRHQCAAFIADEGILVVWDDDVNHIVQRAKDIEKELMDLVWTAGGDEASVDDIAIEKEKNKNQAVVTEVEVDEESGQALAQERPTHLINSTLVGFTLVIVITMLGAGFRSVANEVVTDGNYLRVAFVLLTPIQVFFTLVWLHLGP